MLDGVQGFESLPAPESSQTKQDLPSVTTATPAQNQHSPRLPLREEKGSAALLAREVMHTGMKSRSRGRSMCAMRQLWLSAVLGWPAGHIHMPQNLCQTSTNKGVSHQLL